jgi:hypothetical protein
MIATKPARSVTARLAAPAVVLAAIHGLALLSAAERISNEALVATYDRGTVTIQADGDGAPFASGASPLEGGTATVVAVTDPVFGEGQALEISGAAGTDTVLLYPHLPFALFRSTRPNPGPEPTTVNRVPVLTTTLADIANAVALGTGGLAKPGDNPGSYAWMAVADAQSRAGVVGGWLTHERGSGVVLVREAAGHVQLEARAEYGRLQVEAGRSVRSETFALGRFRDARLGLEAWADAVAKQLAIALKKQPVVYCTWYDNVHGKCSDPDAIAQLSGFAAKALKPFGFTTVQIDDGWQMGDPKGNGPRKNFSQADPAGPYGKGMKPTADAIAADGLVAGLWMLPFGGSYNDPFFAPHQDWFMRKDDGTPFDNAWGGTSLDMSQPGARAFVVGEIRQAVREWGYRYLKLDGLSTGIGVHPKYINDRYKEDGFGNAAFADQRTSNIGVYRDGLRLVREAAGVDTFILGCCAPQNMRSYGGSFGLVDAMRIGPDNNGSWEGWSRVSPRYGSRNYFLNGRIWWNDPDPVYLRPRLTLDQARCIVSWTVLAGQMLSLSDWLPKLPEERLELARRSMPGHTALARPVDLFTADVPTAWLVTDATSGVRRDVVGLYNWTKDAQDLHFTAGELGLPEAGAYVAFDFWANALAAPFSTDLRATLPGLSCRVLAVRPLQPRPFLLSTSRHITQGMVDVRREHWSASASTLAGTSAVVGDDPYELRIFAKAPDRAWQVAEATVSAADQAAGVTIASAANVDGLVRVTVASPVNRDVDWAVAFTGSATDGTAKPGR